MLRVGLVLLSLTLLPWAAEAGSPDGSGGAAWDDAHMRSNFAHRLGAAPPRPPIRGADRYHHVAEDPTPTPPAAVAETTLAINPHEWAPGLGQGASDAGLVERSGQGWSAGARPARGGNVRASSIPRTGKLGMRRSRR